MDEWMKGSGRDRIARKGRKEDVTEKMDGKGSEWE